MTHVQLYALAGGILFCLGWYGIIVQPYLLRKIIALNIMGTGVFMVLVAMAARGGEAVPDPVPQAMVLTGIVVTVSASALAIKLALHIYAVTGRRTLPEDDAEAIG